MKRPIVQQVFEQICALQRDGFHPTHIYIDRQLIRELSSVGEWPTNMEAKTIYGIKYYEVITDHGEHLHVVGRPI